MTVSTQDAWVSDIRSVQEQSGGLLELSVVRRCDLPSLVADALAGSEEAQTILEQVRTMLANVNNAPRKRPALCGACPRAVKRGSDFAIVIAWPACDDPTKALAMTICSRCGSDHAAIAAKAA